MMPHKLGIIGLTRDIYLLAPRQKGRKCVMNFKKAAQESTTLSELMAGKTKLSMDEIMIKYPGGVTLSEFDMITTKNSKTGEDNTYPVFTIEEDKSVCFFGGIVLTRMCEKWLTGYNGDVCACSNDLKLSGGVKVKFGRGKTANGNSVTTVTVLD